MQDVCTVNVYLCNAIYKRKVMKELKCPKCGAIFTVDEADYASILNQVKNDAFDTEVERKIADLHKQKELEQAAAILKTEQGFKDKLSV